GMKPQVDAERPVGERTNTSNLRAQFVRLQAQRGEDPEASRARDLRHELRAGDAAHAGLDDWIADAEEAAEGDGAWSHVSILTETAKVLPRTGLRVLGMKENESSTPYPGRGPRRSRAGFPDALVTIVEYGDYESGAMLHRVGRDVHLLHERPAVRRHLGRSGRIRRRDSRRGARACRRLAHGFEDPLGRPDGNIGHRCSVGRRGLTRDRQAYGK